MSSDVTQRLTAALDGRYRIERRLGEGGMATVYLATDLKHERQVALKVLKPELAAVVGAERFLAEIKTTANLQHPHILPLYDSGSSDGLVWYVMPYLEGESLRERLDREKQLAAKDAVDIAVKVADALDYAHDRGIVHRDVKPGNILLSDRDEPLVADFGIALAVTTAGEGRVTETGLSMGTPHYMSPEQATGDRDVDPRSDIWALGCVLYELLAGDPPFAASSAQAVLARILTEKAPDVSEARPTTPPNVAAVIDTALERLPADRFASAKAYAEALRDPGFTGASRHRAGAGAGRERYRVPFFVAAALTIVATMAAIGFAIRPGEGGDGGPVTRFSLDVSDDFEAGGWNGDLAPNGRAFLWTNNRVLRVHDFTTGETRTFQMEASQPAMFDRTSEAVLYSSDDRLVRQRLADGGVSPVADSVYGMVFSSESWIWGSTRDGRGLVRVDADGTREVVFRMPDDDPRALQPVGVLRDGEVVVLLRALPGFARSVDIEALEVESGRTETLVSGSTGGGSLLDDRTVVFTRSGTIFAVRLGRDGMSTVGDPVPVAEPGGEYTGFKAANGTAVTAALASTEGNGYGLAVRDLSGGIRRLPNLPDTMVGALDLSPDGSTVALTLDPQATPSVWTYELPSGPLTRLSTRDSARAPRFSPDGDRIYYVDEEEVSVRRADGALPPERVLDPELLVTRIEPTPGGERLLLQIGAPDAGTEWGIHSIDASNPGGTTPLIANPAYRTGHPAVSPDGRWLAYYSAESGENQIFVSSLEGPPARQQVSINGTSRPRWGESGELLYFVEDPPVGASVLRRATLDFSTGRPVVQSLDSLFTVWSSEFVPLPGDSLFLTPVWAGSDLVAPPEGFQFTLNFGRLVEEAFERAGR